MDGFFLWGLICGFVCLSAYVVGAVFRKKQPVLGHGIELLASGSGLLGGIKLCWLVFDGELSRLIHAVPSGMASIIAPEDVLYFLVGGVALGWLSLESIVKRLHTVYSRGGRMPQA